MSESVSKVPTNPVSDDEIDEKERLRIRKNCEIVMDFFYFVATSANIPPRSPEIVPPVVDNSDEQCKPLQMPRPIKL